MDDIPFQVTLSMNNSAGFLFGNRTLGVSVQRWVALENFGDAVTLVDYMFEEMAFTSGDTVIVDLRGLEDADSGTLYPLSLIRFCLSGANVRRLAVVGMPPHLGRDAGFNELVAYAKGRDVVFVQSEDFAGATTLLNGTAQATNTRELPMETPAASESTYGGSVTFWPTHSAVVLALAGNEGDPQATAQVVERGLEYCREHAAKILVVDSTASSPVVGSTQMSFVLDKAVAPSLELGLTHVVHVRPHGDKLVQAQGAPDIRAMYEAAGVSYERMPTLAEAAVRLDQLAGHISNAAAASTVRH